MPLTCVCDAVRPGSQQMMGGNAADPGRQVASRWQCHGATSLVDLRGGLSIPRMLHEGLWHLLQLHANDDANDVLPRVYLC